MMTPSSWQEAVFDLEVLEPPDENNDLTPAVTVLGEAGQSSTVLCRVYCTASNCQILAISENFLLQFQAVLKLTKEKDLHGKISKLIFLG